MEYELLAPSTSPTDLATFASRTITWSALHNAIQTLLAESAIATDWFSFFRDIPRDDERDSKSGWDFWIAVPKRVRKDNVELIIRRMANSVPRLINMIVQFGGY